jgi:acyl carrier protein
MNKEQIDQIVKDIITEENEIESNLINDDSSLEDDLGIDSQDLMFIIMEIEQEFNIRIELNEIDEIKTFKYLVDLVQEKLML